MLLEEIVILTPVYNDWPSFQKLLHEIDSVINNKIPKILVTIVAVDDGSAQKSYQSSEEDSFSNIKHIEIISLVRNLGHQKAITIGLAYIQHHYTFPVIVMDSDGEDSPLVIPDLIASIEAYPESIIFAERTHRSEGFFFIFFYMLYRLLFRTLTGKKISFGNFSIIPFSLLSRVVFLPEIWNHFAAGVVRSGLSRQTLPSTRGKRYLGKSKMNFVSLIIHGMSAISVYLEIVAARLIIFSFAVIFAVLVGFVILLYIRFVTNLAISGWATNVAAGLLIILFQSIFFQASLFFLVLNFRSNKIFVPAKDYKDYIFDIKTEYHNDRI